MRNRKKQVTAPVPPAIPVEPIQLLTIPQVAKRLSVGRTKVYRLIKQEGLPSVLVGNAMRVSDQALQKWILDHEQVSYERAS